MVTASAREALDAALKMIADDDVMSVTDSFGAGHDLEALVAAAAADEVGPPIRSG